MASNLTREQAIERLAQVCATCHARWAPLAWADAECVVAVLRHHNAAPAPR
jgi:hypothetical protein